MNHIITSSSPEKGKSRQLLLLTKGLMTTVMAILLFLVPSEVFAQKLTVSGFVKEAATNEPVPGAVVMVKGTSVGTSTDANGAYTLKADANAVLVCQLFGYKTVEVNVSKRTKLDILLQEDTQMLDATVVVGYGTLKKTQLVGAVENLSGEELEGRTNSNVTRSLQGQIPGLNIIQADGKPTHQGSITIRGNGTSYQSRQKVGGNAKGAKHSIGQGSSALVLIDGVEGDLTTVNPEDIETVAVLKDAASAAVYGARGAFGVILVTTKAPKTDKISVNYNGSVSLNRRNIMWEDELVTDGLQWLDTFVEFFRNDKRTPTSAGSLPGNVNNRSNTYSEAYHEEFRRRKTDPTYENYGKIYGDGKDVGFGGNYAYYGSTNWLDMFYKDMNMTQNHNLSINGASEKVSYAISGRYYGQDGIYKLGNEDFNQFNLRAKGSIKITDWLKLTNNTSVFKRKYHQPMVSGGSQPLLRQFEHRGQPIYPAFNEDGTLTFYGASCMYGAFEDGNTYQENNKLDIITSTTLDFEPIKNVLKFTGDFTYKAIRSTQARVSCIQSGYSAPGALETYNNSSYKSDWRFNTDYISSNIVGTYTPKLGDNHDLNIVAGWNLEKTNYRRLYLTRKDLLYPSIPSFELMASDEYGVEDRGHDKSMVGFFGRVNYTLLNRYIVEVAARYDGSSLFPSYSQWGFFPSASVGWRLSEEPWMKWAKSWMNNFKLRANVGSLGNATIDPYSFLELMGVSKSTKLINGEKVPYTTAAAIIPDNLTWETVTTYDVGLDADFLKSRLSISADYYVRDVKDMFIQGPDLPEVLGDSTPKGNYGAIQTKGWEATIGWRDSFKLAGKDFNYNIKASVWDSRTWVKTYYNINGDILNYYEGKELGEIWGFRTDGYFLSNEEANNWATDKFHKNGSNFRAYAGDLKFIDINGDGKIDYGKGTLDDHGDLERIGNQSPRYYFGINLGANWNGIGVSVFLQGVGKRDWYPSCESGFFWGMYNRPYGYLPKIHTQDAVEVDYSTSNWVVTNAASKPYFTRQVAYAANRNDGPLTFENDYYMQNAAYVRLKNLTVDYTFPSKLTKKIRVEKLKVYFSGENLLTFSPIYKHTKMFDPETLGFGDSDFGDNVGGLSGVGQGYTYPMLKTYTFGLNITF